MWVTRKTQKGGQNIQKKTETILKAVFKGASMGRLGLSLDHQKTAKRKTKSCHKKSTQY